MKFMAQKQFQLQTSAGIKFGHKVNTWDLDKKIG
jgi:hypothetical protein